MNSVITDYVDKLSLRNYNFSILRISEGHLNNKMDEFASFVDGLQFKFAKIVVTETWENDYR
jgi:hypothetical protein